MKRDARIGLAVVLVLGLAVTLLVGRALFKRDSQMADAELQDSPGSAAAYSTDGLRVDGAETARASATMPAVPDPLPPVPGESAARPAEPNPGLQSFIDDNTARIGSAPVARGPVIEVPLEMGGNRNPPQAEPAPQPRPAPAPAPQNDRTDWLDHEHAQPPVADPMLPADGFGYTIAPGDNVWKISSKVYGDGKYTQKIVDANPDLKPSKMKPGTVIRIPIIQNKTILMKLPSFADASKSPARGMVAERNADSGGNGPVTSSRHVESAEKTADSASSEATTHKVESGDTLGSIAKRYYGFSGPKSVGRILSANKGLDASKLKLGQVLTIPAK